MAQIPNRHYKNQFLHDMNFTSKNLPSPTKTKKINKNCKIKTMTNLIGKHLYMENYGRYSVTNQKWFKSTKAKKSLITLKIYIF